VVKYGLDLNTDDWIFQRTNRFEVLLYEVDEQKMIKTNDLSSALKVKECELPKLKLDNNGEMIWEGLTLTFNACLTLKMIKTLIGLMERKQELGIRVFMYSVDGYKNSELNFKDAIVDEIDLGELTYDREETKEVKAIFSGKGLDINFNE